MSFIIGGFGDKAHRFVTRDPLQDKKYTLLEGSVRSSKTFAVDAKLISKLCFYEVDGKRVICGATKQTVYKNMLLDIFAVVGKKNYSYNQASGELWLFGKQWFVIGAKDEASFKNILGMTIGIAICDEWSTFPRSFTMQLFMRLSPRNARLYATTNPDNPFHYLKTEVIENADMKDDLEVIHFTLDDNPHIAPEVRRQIESSQTGVFYQRYILGLWVIAEGSIYKDSWHDDLLYDAKVEPPILRTGRLQRIIPIDYGTTNPMVFLDVYDDGKTYWLTREYYWDSAVQMRQKTDAEYADDLVKFIGEFPDGSTRGVNDRMGAKIIIDPSAASFKVELEKRGIWYEDADNDVLEGIKVTSMVLNKRMVRICRERAEQTIKQMQTYAWDTKAAKRGEEKPIKQNDHGPDALRYFCKTEVPAWRLAA